MTGFKQWQIKEGNRLYLKGTSSLSNSEILAFILRDKMAAERLLARFRTLRDMMDTSIEELKEVEGINNGRAEQLVSCFELFKRLRAEPMDNMKRVKCPEDAVQYLGGELECMQKEVFKVLLLNTKNRVIRIITVAIGSLNAALVHPREILKPAIKASSAGIILVHNHPTGDPEPSREDLELTTRIAKSCELIGIDLLDHIIIGTKEKWVSLRERGSV